MNPISEYFTEFENLTELVETVSHKIREGDSINSTGHCLKKFLMSGELSRIIRKCVTEFTENFESALPFLGPNHILFCNEFGGLFIGLGCGEKGDDSSPLYSSPGEILLGSASANGFSYETSSIFGRWQPNVYSSKVGLGPPTLNHCKFGDVLHVTTSTVFDYRSNGDYILKIVAPRTSELTWEFDRKYRTPTRVFSSTLEATTITYILKFLSQYGDDNSIPAVISLTRHPCYHVRWEAVKALGNMDSMQLARVLEDLRDDPHPQIRSASLKTLLQMEHENGH